MTAESLMHADEVEQRPATFGVARAMNAAGTALILLLVGAMLADIGGRILFNRPLSGVPEIVAMVIVAILFLQIPHAVAARSLIQSDMLLEALRATHPRLAYAVTALSSGIGALVFAMIVYASWRFLMRAIENADTYGTPGVFEFPQWPLRAVVVLGAAWTVVEFLKLAWQDLGHVWRPL